jgi:hypothetical protein
VGRNPLNSDDLNRTMPRTEDSAERGLVDQDAGVDPQTYGNLGESDELDDDAGDIADEGSGHRG